MSTMRKTLIHGAIALLCSLTVLTCTSEINREGSPVELVAHVTDLLSRVDLADVECPNFAQFEIENVIKNPTAVVDTRFLDVVLRSYRVRFTRTDGGSTVPRERVQALSVLIPAGETVTEIPTLGIFNLGALSEAPFAALDPTAGTGGRDPETGQTAIRMDVIVDFFGETLSGEAVSTSMRFPLTFCVSCGGCFPKG